MVDTASRMLRLLSVLQLRREWGGQELAERLAVTPRTVRRDVERLRALGYPVHATPGVAGGYRLGAGGALPPLLLDDEEAVAVALGLRTAAGGTVRGIEEASLRALAKLEQVLPSRLRHRVNALESVTIPASGTRPSIDPAVLTWAGAACRDHDRIRFGYHDHGGSLSVRTAEPHRLVHTGQRWYLLAFDTGRDDWRTFRVDRITPRNPTGPRFVPRPPPEPDVTGYTSWAVSNAPYRYRGRFTIYAPAETVADLVSPTAGMIETIDENTCLLRAGANSLDALAIHLSTIGAEFVVHEPVELTSRIAELADRLHRASA